MSKRTQNVSEVVGVTGTDSNAEVFRDNSTIEIQVWQGVYPPSSFVGNVAQINELINALTRHMRDANQWEIENGR